ncbi:hypothetical protein BCU68_12915 [Vibrio sp. 10N.286.49.B3]|uniref:DUF1656 domain-containing protein n=1 Tax=Vibrio sp. 10N.286.49.B3 TaxID=1880855 RepID=UPI000C857F58|nr:DUF1656 domain-containing protein [Vibrio sp. 10N.286.49.B3]PMH43748.1 hypothetical protein BCU68_12915 [Vibrio sp. 10N.286.49.B3]
MPQEIVFGEIYLSPLLIVLTLAYLSTYSVSHIMIKLGLYKYIAAPAIAELSLLVIFSSIIAQFILVI